MREEEGWRMQFSLVSKEGEAQYAMRFNEKQQKYCNIEKSVKGECVVHTSRV